ncbi:multidrug efflux SMR transporter [Corynebacterium sp. HS2168-gen11]|uniref:DMT family transporter n=1 Tax=Corynebacterium sp. HS2168-gen11 TaxID=2974027 RepID=UPI00216B0396|nr:SMR family transporter [Corynebacterium sp. HS2168-gen11]MCS4535266.1 SMR family transporter [Corynebacterium sp. HS2168-gen11]
MRKWGLLLVAIASEVTATLSLKAALHTSALYIVVIVGYVLSYAALAGLLQKGVPLGVAYGIWGACGVALTAVFGTLLYDEPLSAISGLGIMIIIAGIVLVETGSPKAPAA